MTEKSNGENFGLENDNGAIKAKAERLNISKCKRSLQRENFGFQKENGKFENVML